MRQDGYLLFARIGMFALTLSACASSAPRVQNDSDGGTGVTVAVSPAAASMKVGQTQQFSATVANATNTAVNWSVTEGSAGGTVSSSGLYVAPANAGTYHVVATSAADPAASTSADAIVRTTTPQVGVWTSVTPQGVDLTNPLSCGNFGVESVQVDPKRPSDVYAMFHCQGIWKSTDFGYTWEGPINTGSNGAAMAGAGKITIPAASKTTPPLLYAANIRNPGIGFWRSVDGGVNWALVNVAPGGTRQDFYAPVADPYDANHLLIAGHEDNVLALSDDGGLTWTAVHTEGGMQQNGGTAFVFFVDTGSPSSTRNTFLWIGQQSGGTYGTWRTSDAGASWTKVDANEHPHGASQIYQPGNGVLFMAGAYSALGWGLLRSTDSGQHWTHQGAARNEAVAVGTANKVYSMYGWAAGHQVVDPTLESSAQPGDAAWISGSTPSQMSQGPAQMVTTFDGTHAVVITANYSAGLWLFVEP